MNERARTTPPDAARPEWPDRKLAASLAALVFLVTAAVSAWGWFRFEGQRATLRGEAQRTLAAVADLKASEIENWLDERRADANFAVDSMRVREFLAKPGDAAAREDLLRWMRAAIRSGEYESVLVLDSAGTVRLAVPPDAPAEDPTLAPAVRSTLGDGGVVFVDLHRNPATQAISLGFLVPVHAEAGARGAADGVIAFLVDPHHRFYRLVQSWPTASLSAETLLVQRDGRDVVYLNDLRHRAGTALGLRFTVADRPRLPAALATRGLTSVGDGIDYRGRAVLAEMRRIPGTPWSVVAKMDQAEVDAPLRWQGTVDGSMVALVFAAAAMGAGFLWRQQHLKSARQALAEHAAAEAAARRLSDELERRVAERTAELRAAYEELEAFSYSVSHDLRAPLRTLDGFSQALLEDQRDQLDPRGRDYLQRIRAGAQRMSRLIDDLLTLARLGRQPMRAEVVLPHALVDDALVQLAGERDGRRVTVSIGDLRPCQGDARLLGLVWVNLLANALKATRTREEAIIEIDGRIENRECVYSVKDNGIGFDMQYAGKLFAAFERLHSVAEFPGNGVGLAIVRSIVVRHGGRVWAEGAVGVGATFHFTVPAPEQPARAEA